MREKQSFREIQSHQLRQMQSLVEDIVKANDQYRDFNIATLCLAVAGESDTILKQKRQVRVSVDHFAETSLAVAENGSKRASEVGRCKEIQESMQEAVVDASTTENGLVQSTKRILAGIEKTAASEWRHDLDRVQKKLRTMASHSAAQTKQKLSAIEKTFNTDDLRVMQQMLQRI